MGHEQPFPGRRLNAGMARTRPLIVAPTKDCPWHSAHPTSNSFKRIEARSPYCAVMPPSTTRLAPVMKPEPSEAGKTMPLAMSVAVPLRADRDAVQRLVADRFKVVCAHS